MKFSKGSIVRIYLKDFLTFDEIEMFPKNKLNLVIGPNGAGKSTFVCAIVLGLGGKPVAIGKITNTADYVKHGREKAVIELELYNPDGSNIVISRHITSNSSSWFLQGKPTTLKKVESVTQELNIQINNLCQILPQDRVQDFAKMDQKQLLENTQRSIDQELIKQFEELKSVRSSLIKREEMFADLLIKYDNEKQKNKRMEADVKNYRERQDTLEKISLMHKKMAWLLYEEKNELRKKMLVTYEAAKERCESLEKNLEPLLNEIKNVESEQQNLKKKSKAEENKSNQINQSLNDLLHKHLQSKDKISKIRDELKSKLEAEAQKENVIQEIQRQMEEMKSSLPQVEEPELLGSIKKCDLEIDVMTSKITNAKTQEGQLRDKSSVVNQAKRSIEHKLNLLNSVSERKLELLTRNLEDVAKAYEWLLSNRHQFQHKVYGPIFMEVNVPDPNHAKYFEHIISRRDLVAFVCEDAKDMSKLLGILRNEKNLKINAITSTPLKCSLQEMFPPRVPVSVLQQLGFQKHLLLDLIEGPDVILKYLCNLFNIHNIPIGTKQAEHYIDRIPNEIRLFFIENSCHKVSSSKYTCEKLRTVGEVGKAKFLIFPLNKTEITACNQKLLRISEEMQAIEVEVQNMAEIRRKFDIELNNARNNRRHSSKQLEYLRTTNVGLRVKREKLEELAKSKIDPSIEEAKAKRGIEGCIKEMVLIEAKTVEIISSYMRSKENCELMQMNLQRLAELFQKKESDSRELKKNVTAAKDEIEKVKAECVAFKTELKAIHLKAKQQTDGLDANDPGFIEKYVPLFQNLPGDRRVLQEHLFETEAMARCLNNTVDINIIEEYEASLKQMEHLELQMEKLKAHQSGIVSRANDLLSSWLPKLQELIDEVNEKFGAFFAAMGCAGLVELNQGTNPDHYENYGLVIKVKFRNENELQILDSHTQSGGERALTTAVFLLSLQTISKVPFRCVDEINQGMDEINEKRVYHLIMNSISTCDTAQYFLVTPTLLPGVIYPDGTALHCVHSTKEEVISSKVYWNKERYFRHLGITDEL